jgi:hypothetical protein
MTSTSLAQTKVLGFSCSNDRQVLLAHGRVLKTALDAVVAKHGAFTAVGNTLNDAFMDVVRQLRAMDGLQPGQVHNFFPD